MPVDNMKLPLEFIDFSAVGDDACRLFHGRGHAYVGFEHVNIDWLAPVVLITLYEEESADYLQSLATQLHLGLSEQCKTVLVQFRCREMAPIECLKGEPCQYTEITENGMRFNLEFGRAQNTGLFLDMANGREWVKAHAENANVLNLFAYTCAFSVAALAGGAEKVINVDLSRTSLSVGRDNHRSNQHDLKRVKFEGVDIFKSYGRLRKHGPYDLLISDPPSFQKGSVDIKRDYSKIIKRIPQLVKPGGKVMLCLNAPELGEQFLFDNVAEHCPDCVFQEQLLPPAVYKEAEDGKGLKVLIFTYLPIDTASIDELMPNS
jgi:23S rRNA (cytosine1962-C5)-methyltransferase